jgi:hypothetical protein
MKKLLALVFLLLVCIPTFAQDATEAATVEANPVTVIDGTGEGNTIVNVGGETPAETPETPAEPMPWWAVAGLEITKLVAIYLTVVHGARVALQAFMNNPARVAAAENAVNLVKSVTPDALEDAARLGAEKAIAATSELFADLRRTIDELTDGVPAGSKPRPVSPASSVSSTGGSFDSSQSRLP